MLHVSCVVLAGLRQKSKCRNEEHPDLLLVHSLWRLAMKTKEPLFPQRDGFSTVSIDGQTESSAIRAIATQDHDVIRQWAERHHAEPATGIETPSGPATLNVSDGGTVVRFNFPAAARFRMITWEEWFEIFDRRRLLFVYEEETADRAYEVWQSRGAGHGHALDDWLEAEHQLEPAGSPSARYRFVRQLEEPQEG
jgi:Protein of unknown function (DUF2934)